MPSNQEMYEELAEIYERLLIKQAELGKMRRRWQLSNLAILIGANIMLWWPKG